MPKHIDEIMWACICQIKNKEYLFPDTVRRTRRQSIAAFLPENDRTWKHWRKKGYKCIKVRVTPYSKD